MRRLAGLNLGGGVRHQDSVTIGYPPLASSDDFSIDLSNPIKGPSEIFGEERGRIAEQEDLDLLEDRAEFIHHENLHVELDKGKIRSSGSLGSPAPWRVGADWMPSNKSTTSWSRLWPIHLTHPTMISRSWS